MLVILPYVAFAVIPITILYWMMLFYYRKSATDLQRLDAVSRSPIQAMVTEGELIYYCGHICKARFLAHFVHGFYLMLRLRWCFYNSSIPEGTMLYRSLSFKSGHQ